MGDGAYIAEMETKLKYSSELICVYWNNITK